MRHELTQIDNFTLHLGVNSAPTIGRVRTTNGIASTLPRLLKDIEQAKALALALEGELVDDENAKGSDVVQETIERLVEGEEDLQKVSILTVKANPQAKITLDQWISYLRHGLHTCYYCVAPFSYAEELQRKCVAHVRLPSPIAPVESMREEELRGEDREEKQEMADEAPEKAEEAQEKPDKPETRDRLPTHHRTNEEKWGDALDHRIAPLIDEVDVVEYCGRDIEE